MTSLLGRFLRFPGEWASFFLGAFHSEHDRSGKAACPGCAAFHFPSLAFTFRTRSLTSSLAYFGRWINILLLSSNTVLRVTQFILTGIWHSNFQIICLFLINNSEMVITILWMQYGVRHCEIGKSNCKGISCSCLYFFK